MKCTECKRDIPPGENHVFRCEVDDGKILNLCADCCGYCDGLMYALSGL